MFPSRYFADRYFAPRYFPKVGDDAPIVSSVAGYATWQSSVMTSGAWVLAMVRA